MKGEYKFMKKKAIKLATSTAIAASAFVAGAPVQKADAAVNVDQLVKAAEASAKVLQWSISTEGTADFVTRPYAAYNAAKATNKAAKAEVAKLAGVDKAVYEARLLDSDLQIKRAGAYIDALTSGEKIVDKQAALDKAIKAGDLKAVQSSYHVLTAEIRKQAGLLYKVYGQSTRDGILSTFKVPAEKLYKSVTNEVTVLDHAALVAKYTADKDYSKAVDHVEKAEYALENVKQFKAELTKNLNDAVDALPLMVTSVTRVDANTVQVKFTKALDSAPLTHFSFDKGLYATSSKLSDDSKTVTLSVTGQKSGETYTLSYKGEVTKSFTVPTAPEAYQPITGTTDEVRLEKDQYRTYVFTLKDFDKRAYEGLVEITLKETDVNGDPAASAGDVATIYSVNGKTSPAAADLKTNKDGVLTLVIKTAGQGKVVPTIKNLVTAETYTKAGATIVVAEPTPGKDLTAGGVVEHVDSTNDYFTNAFDKYNFKKTDLFQIGGSAVTYDEFKKELKKFAKVSVNYTAGGQNVFNITEKVSGALLTVNKASERVKLGTDNYDLHGTGQPGKLVKITQNAVDTWVEVTSNGTWKHLVRLADGLNTVTVEQYNADKVTKTPGEVKKIEITQADFKFAAVNPVVATDGVSFGSEVTFTFDTSVITDEVANFAKGTQFTVIDAAYKEATFTIGSLETEVINDTNKTDKVTVRLGKPTSNNGFDASKGPIKLNKLIVKNGEGLSLSSFSPIVIN